MTDFRTPDWLKVTLTANWCMCTVQTSEMCPAGGYNHRQFGLVTCGKVNYLTSSLSTTHTLYANNHRSYTTVLDTCSMRTRCWPANCNNSSRWRRVCFQLVQIRLHYPNNHAKCMHVWASYCAHISYSICKHTILRAYNESITCLHSWNVCFKHLLWATNGVHVLEDFEGWWWLSGDHNSEAEHWWLKPWSPGLDPHWLFTFSLPLFVPQNLKHVFRECELGVCRVLRQNVGS